MSLHPAPISIAYLAWLFLSLPSAGHKTTNGQSLHFAMLQNWVGLSENNFKKIKKKKKGSKQALSHGTHGLLQDCRAVGKGMAWASSCQQDPGAITHHQWSPGALHDVQMWCRNSATHVPCSPCSQSHPQEWGTERRGVVECVHSVVV